VDRYHDRISPLPLKFLFVSAVSVESVFTLYQT